jgi:hypothetical protein
MKNRILAMPAAVPAIPPKPSAAAIRANTKNTSAQPSIIAPYVCSLVSPQEEQERCHLPFRPSQHARSALCVSDQRHHAGARSGEIRSQHRRFLARSRAAHAVAGEFAALLPTRQRGARDTVAHTRQHDGYGAARKLPFATWQNGPSRTKTPPLRVPLGRLPQAPPANHIPSTSRCPARRAARQEDEAIVQAPMACLPALSAAAPA